MKAFVEDRKKEVHYHKNEISFLKKSLEALEVRAREQGTEIDNLWSVLARAPEEVMKRHEASADYIRDLEASIEQYKSSSDYAIKLTKEWISAEYHFIDLSGFDKFLTQRKGKGK